MRYGFLASAIAGRQVSVHASARGDLLACSDGRAIIVPLTNGSGRRLPWLPVAAQAALLAVGSLDAVVLRQLLGRPELTRRYVYLEVLRASHAVAHRLPPAFGRQPELSNTPPLSGTVWDSLALAKSDIVLPGSPAYFGTVRPMLALRRAVGDEGIAALTRRRPLNCLKRRDVPQLDEGAPTEPSAILRRLQNPLASGSFLSDFLNELFGAGVSQPQAESSANEGRGGELPIGRVERGLRRGVQAMLAKLPIALPAVEPIAPSAASMYPEWDDHLGAYRHNWVLLEEVEAWRADGRAAMRDLLQQPPRELRRQMAALGLDHEMHRRQKDGADLDVGALIECAIDLHSGHSPPHTHVYRASRRTRRDLAVVVVLDISGSTAESAGSADSVFNKQLQLVYRLGVTLDALGDTLAVFGFQSWGRKRVHVVRIKGHEERWSGRTAERMSLLEPVGYTRTGTAIRHGARLLREGMRLPNRLLMLITDGIAYDQDYEHRYAERDSHKALEEAKTSGIACVCVSVGSGTDTAKLSQVFGVANILAVDEVEQITGRIRQVCRRALASVSQRRFARVPVRNPG